MKICGVIPARYASSRFPGKPLADICGKPMIWWVYQQASAVNELDELYVATDDERIKETCEKFDVKVLMTSKECFSIVDRLYEVSNIIPADYYVCIMGDEPLLESENIPKVIPKIVSVKPYIRALMRNFSDPVEVIDPSNIKLAVADDGKCVFISRSPIPYPQKTLEFTYKKFMGVHCYNKAALDFYKCTPQSALELIEDIGELRFIVHGVDFYFTLVESMSLSVDTQKDLERVRIIAKEKIERREFSINLLQLLDVMDK
jgi:3-deoxy-manno-octulosonate cytidylyltransferase (CMP-KDO synthetase)